MAAYGRNQAINAESLISAGNRMIFNNENIRRQQMSANNRAYSNVALRPVAGFAPPPPVMMPGPSPLGLIGGIASCCWWYWRDECIESTSGIYRWHAECR